MTDSNTVPWLRKGTGHTPADGGCILQVIDWIDRNEWTDKPRCVHPVLQALAISANDALGDDGRQKLLDLVPRLMGTRSDDRVLSVRLAVFCARYVLPIFEAKYPNDDRPRKAIEAAELWCEEPSKKNADAAHAASAGAVAAASAAAYAAAAAYTTAHAASAASAAAAAARGADHAASSAAYVPTVYPLLLAVLDEYDRLTGRSKVAPVDTPLPNRSRRSSTAGERKRSCMDQWVKPRSVACRSFRP